MKKYEIEQTELFEKRFNKLIPKNLKEKIKKQILKLSYNPYNSKPLGYKYFREKRIQKWRIYFIIHEEKLIVYFIDISDKKAQQETINKIKKEYLK